MIPVKIYNNTRFGKAKIDELREIVDKYAKFILGRKHKKVSAIHINFNRSRANEYENSSAWFLALHDLYNKETGIVRIYLGDFNYKNFGWYRWSIFHDLCHLKEVLDGDLVRLGSNGKAYIKYKSKVYKHFDGKMFDKIYIGRSRRGWTRNFFKIAPWEVLPFILADAYRQEKFGFDEHYWE